MSPESSSAPRIVTGLSPADSLKSPSIETVNRMSTKKATLMRSRRPTFREPARESAPPAQRSYDEDTLTTLPQMQVEELVLSPVTSISNGSEQVQFLSLDEPTETSLRRLTTKEPDRAAILLEPAPHEGPPLVVEDQEPNFLSPVQRIRRMSTVHAEPTNVFSRRKYVKEFKRSDTFSPIQQVRRSTTLVPSQQQRASTQSSLNEGKEDLLPSPPIQQTSRTTAAPLFEQRRTSTQPTLIPEQDQSDFLPPVQRIRRSTTVSTKPEASRGSSPVVQEQDDFDFSLPVERIRRVTTVLPAAERHASTVAERAISPELLLSLGQHESDLLSRIGKMRRATTVSLVTQQREDAVLERNLTRESLRTLDDDGDHDDNESEFLYPVERIRRATTEVPHEQTQRTEELEHDATLSEPEDPEQLLPVGGEESVFQPRAERIRRTTSFSPSYQNEQLPF
jgi:hypothetical protein